MRFCAACGGRQPAGAKFCGECGAALATAATTPAYAPTAPLEPTAAIAPTAPLGIGKPGNSASEVTGDTVAPSRGRGTRPDPSLTPAAGLPPQTAEGVFGLGPQHPTAAGATPDGEWTSGAASVAASARSRFAISQEVAKGAVADGLLALAVQVALLTVLVAVLAAATVTGHTGNPLDWFRAAVAVAALSVHGQLGASAAGTGSGSLLTSASGTADVALTFQLLTLTATSMVATYVLNARRERAQPSTTLPHLVSTAGSGALAYAAGLSVLGLLVRGTAIFGLDDQARSFLSGRGLPSDVTFGPVFVTTAIGAVVVTFVAGLAARYQAYTRRRALAAGAGAGVGAGVGAADGDLPGWAQSWVRPVFSALTTLSAALVVGAIAVAGYAAYELIRGLLTSAGSPVQDAGRYASDAAPNTGGSIIGGLLVLAVALPNVVIYALGASMGATLEVSAAVTGGAGQTVPFGGSNSYQHGVGLLSGGLPGAAWLLVLVPTAAAVVVGVRDALRRDPHTQPWTPWWRHGLAYAALWLALAVATQLRLGAAADVTLFGGQGGNTNNTVTGFASAGLNLPSAVGAAFVWGVATFAAGQVMARGVAAALPRTATVLAGRRLHPLWAVQLAELTHRTGRPVPPSLLERAQQAAASSPTDPLVPLPERRRAGRLVLVLAAVAVGAGVAWTVVGDIVSMQVFGPKQAVVSFYSAFEAGDADTALRQIDVPSGADRSLLTAAALQAQNKAGSPGHVSVDKVTVDGDQAQVDVAVSAGDGTTSKSTVSLVRDTATTHWGVFHGWRLTGGLPTVTVNASGPVQKVTADGVDVSLATSYLAFPGVVPVAVAGPSSQFTTGTDKLTVLDWGAAREANLAVEVGPAGQKAIADAVIGQIQKCTKSTSANPSNCPFSDSGAYSDGRWTEQGTPSVSVTTDSGGQITITGSASLTFTWPTTDFSGSTTSQADQVNATFTGNVQVVGDGFSITNLTPSY